MRDNGEAGVASEATIPQPYTIRLWGSYKSILESSENPLVWADIPPLAILTGVNGAGKSQLLDGIERGLRSPDPLKPFSLVVDTPGVAFLPHEVRYYPDLGHFPESMSIGLAELDEVLQSLANSGARSLEPSGGNRLRMLLKDLHVRGTDPRTRKEWLEDNLGALFQTADVFAAISLVFQHYRAEYFVAFEGGLDRAEIKQVVGPAPWDVVNEILTSANFPYRVLPPGGPPGDKYTFTLHSLNDLRLQPTDLSSGERAILATALWMYSSDYEYSLPKLLLLDEPDAHLHPSLTKAMLNVFQKVLVPQGVRVILTTHSPSTVAMAPHGSVYEMYKESPRIRPASSRWHATGLLTSGFVTVGPDSKHVFTEDRDDAAFFEVTERVLTSLAPLTGEPPALSPAPTLVFIPSSTGQASGGKARVTEWISKIVNTGVHGIIDRDSGNNGGDRLHRLARYEHENYLLDPVVVYAALANIGRAPSIPGVRDARLGMETILRQYAADEVQVVIDYMLGAVAEVLTGGPDKIELDEGRHSVSIVNGPTVTYPKWFLEVKGKTLYQPFQRLFGKELQRQALLLAYERIGWVPVDLLELLTEIQRA